VTSAAPGPVTLLARRAGGVAPVSH